MTHKVRPAAVTLAMLLLAIPMAGSASGTCPAERTTVGLPDHQWTANRVVESCEPLRGSWQDLQLDEVPAWVVAHPTEPGNSWVLAGSDGTVSELHKGELTVIAQVPAGEAPAAIGHEGELEVRARAQDDGADPIPGGRWANTGSVAAELTGPTDRYPHGVLGDDIEASGLSVWTDHSSGATVELPDHEVIEGISTIAADLDDDGPLGFLVTVSDADEGARLRAYDEVGGVIAESDPIGRGFRWLHQIGVGRTGPHGEIEVIAVRTPHIGGIVEAYRLEGDRFERVATIEGYSSHQIGSPNLDMALLADTDADGQLEVVVPTQAMTEMAILRRTSDGFVETSRLPLGGRLASNVAAAIGRDGRLSLAAATEDGRLRVFR